MGLVRQARRAEFAGNLDVVVPGHVDHDGGFQRHERAPIGCVGPAGGVSGQENQGVGRLAMGQGNLRSRCGCQGGRDAGNNFKLDVSLAQGCDFFADAPEDKRIAAFEPHDL